jgi:hypothetical protein
MQEFISVGQRRPQRLVLTLLLGAALAAGPALAAEGIDPEVDQVLKSMSDFLAANKSFSVKADIDFEVVTRHGQKLQLSSFAALTVERPVGMYIERSGIFADVQMYFDGKTLTAYGKRNNAYAQLAVDGSNDDAILAYEFETGIPAPGADLLFSNPYAMLSGGIESASYIGTTRIDGIECYHLAFREENVDWQIWVQTGKTPLPMKYVITSTWDAFAPQYQIRFHDWNLQPKVARHQFDFKAPKDATKLELAAFGDSAETGAAKENAQ